MSCILALALLLSGCGAGVNRNENDSSTQTDSEAVENEEVTEDTTADTGVDSNADTSVDSNEDNADTELLVLTAINLTGIDIGMFSVIDPATGEQTNIGGLKSYERYTFECNWPKDTKEFQWALYNMEGELCIEATTDISSAEQAAFLIMLGKDNVEDVKVYYDDEVENVDLDELVKPYEE